MRHAFRSALSLAGVTGLLGSGLALASIAPAAADEVCASSLDLTTVTCTYLFTGAEQAFVVPDGVAAVAVTASGSAGGRSVDGPVGTQPAVRHRRG